MKTKGKFILLSIDEMGTWIEANEFSRVIKLVQNHHTYIPSYKFFDGNNHFKLLEGMEGVHIKRGFSEVAQNITTFPDGMVAICRPLEKIPAGIFGANEYGISVEHLGDFDSGADLLNDAHRGAVIDVNAYLCAKFNLTPGVETVVYHHWYDLDTGERTGGAGNTKSCPGTGFFNGNRIEDAAADFIPLIAKKLCSLQAPPTQARPLRSAVVTATSLKVRMKPDSSAPVVKSLSRGVTVNVYDEINGWYRVHPSDPNWVYGKYLEFHE